MGSLREILITGGTGTLGTALIKRLYRNPDNKITVVSRDENKQKRMAKIFPDVRYRICDISCKDDVYALGFKRPRYDHIYHCAAFKHIEVCEEHPHRTITTNYMGTKYLYDILGKDAGRFTFFSTDKAVAPINTYGYSKALAEKYIEQFKNTQIFRWGNIIGSTGSFLPYLVECGLADEKVYVTCPAMTRFWVYIDEAAKFVLSNADYIGKGALYPKMVSASLDTVVSAVGIFLGRKIPIWPMDVRPGEKMHECMIADLNGVRERSCDNTLNVDEFLEFIEPWLKKYLSER